MAHSMTNGDESRSSLSSINDSWMSESLENENSVTNAELGLAEDHFSRPEGHFGLSSLEELRMAIDNCKELVMMSPEHSDKRRNLVKKLVQLRIKMQETKEGPIAEALPGMRNVLGHHFVRRHSKSSKHYCEKCNSVIWGMLQAWYRCTECAFCCHHKCLNLVTRTCAGVKVSENCAYVLSVCPEAGLATQLYRCADCRAKITFKSGAKEARLCDYSGQYYCPECHWNDLVIIPARVVHNWDFVPRTVSRASKQFLKLMIRRSVIYIENENERLFSFVAELNQVKKMRQEILMMKKYFMTCKDALDSRLLLNLQDRQHFVENSDQYSLQDLIDLESGVLLEKLQIVRTDFTQHIKRDCKLCQGKGYVCELCDKKEIIFPFDEYTTICSECSTVYHRGCYSRKNVQACPKCKRKSERQ